MIMIWTAIILGVWVVPYLSHSLKCSELVSGDCRDLFLGRTFISQEWQTQDLCHQWLWVSSPVRMRMRSEILATEHGNHYYTSSSVAALYSTGWPYLLSSLNRTVCTNTNRDTYHATYYLWTLCIIQSCSYYTIVYIVHVHVPGTSVRKKDDIVWLWLVTGGYIKQQC